jgi:hypothetical protein
VRHTIELKDFAWRKGTSTLLEEFFWSMCGWQRGNGQALTQGAHHLRIIGAHLVERLRTADPPLALGDLPFVFLFRVMDSCTVAEGAWWPTCRDVLFALSAAERVASAEAGDEPQEYEEWIRGQFNQVLLTRTNAAEISLLFAVGADPLARIPEYHRPRSEFDHLPGDTLLHILLRNPPPLGETLVAALLSTSTPLPHADAPPPRFDVSIRDVNGLLARDLAVALRDELVARNNERDVEHVRTLNEGIIPALELPPAEPLLHDAMPDS